MTATRPASVETVPVQLTTRDVTVADAIDALCGLRTLLGEDRVFLLESLAGPAADLRTSVVGVTGLLEVSVYRSAVTLTGEPELIRRTTAALLAAGVASPTAEGGLTLVTDDGMFDLARVLDRQYAFDRDPRTFGFGLLVFYGYDAVRYVERLPRIIADHPQPTPDAVFSLVHALVSVDLGSGSARLTVAESPVWPALNVDALTAAVQQGPSGDQGEDVPTPRDVSDDTTEQTYLGWADRCLEHIRVGDIYQVQIGHEISVRTDASELAVYRRLRRRNPSPYMSLLPIAGRTVVGASPELFLRLEGAPGEWVATMRPIAGTIRRTGDPERDEIAKATLLADPKEQAEHVMLVDLCRNDLGRISESMSVEVAEFMHIEAYSHVFHIVSDVDSRVRSDYDVYDVIKASFPAGTMTGAPKVRAMEIIESIESSRRGLYAGAFGLIAFGGPTMLGLAIRAAVRSGDTYTLRASAGMVADSEPAKEWRETLTKLGATYWAVTGTELT
ncbi:MAG: anthranilate synthase component I family protein [Propionibacteriaceae bacterium]